MIRNGPCRGTVYVFAHTLGQGEDWCRWAGLEQRVCQIFSSHSPAGARGLVFVDYDMT